MHISTDLKPLEICVSDPSKLCPSLLLLQIPYIVLIYRYCRSLMYVINHKLIHHYDYTDRALIFVSMMQLFSIPSLLFLQIHQLFYVVKFCWFWCIYSIYVQFQSENEKRWKISITLSFIAYLSYAVYLNLNMRDLYITLPVRIPIDIMILVIVMVGLYQLWEIRSILQEKNELSPTILAAIKIRRSFVMVMGGCMVVSRFVSLQVIDFRDIFGTVIFMILKDWIMLGGVYWSLLMGKNSNEDEDRNR